MDLTVMWWMHNIPPPLKLMLLFLFFSVTLCILNYEYPPCLTTPVFHMLHANLQHSTVLSMDTMHTGAFHVTHHATCVFAPSAVANITKMADRSPLKKGVYNPDLLTHTCVGTLQPLIRWVIVDTQVCIGF